MKQRKKPAAAAEKKPSKHDALRLVLIQMKSAKNAHKRNVEKACCYIDQAMAQHPDLIVLPEMFAHEYFCQFQDSNFMRYAEPADGPTLSAMQSKAREHSVHLVATIFERAPASHYFDTAFIIQPNGAIAGKYRKVHPSPLEKNYFRGGSSFPVFDVCGWKVGLSICYDNWFPESARCLALNGAEVIVAPFATGRPKPWEEVLVARAIDNQVYVAACNHVGREGKLDMSGRSLIIDPTGRILVEASDTKDEIISATCEREVLVKARAERQFMRDRKPQSYGVLTVAPDELYS